MKSTLIYSIEITGHHTEYISHLIDYIGRKEGDMHYFFVLHPEFKLKFPDILNKALACPYITIVEITNNELFKINKGNTLAKSINNYRLLLKYAIHFNVVHLTLLHFNLFIFSLSIYRPKYEISGILFHPFYRIEKNSLRSNLLYIRKFVQTYLFALNRQIKTIFILNDNKTTNYLNRQFKTNIFKVLPDPIPEWTPIPDFSINEKYSIKNARRIFLHIGALEERKGTFEILDSFNFLNSGIRRDICLLIIGKANSETHQAIISKVSDLKTRFPEIEIIYKNEFISNSLMKSLFEQSEFVLVPYKNTESSSGIIGHAIAAGTIIIGPNRGLIGELINSYIHSITLDEINPESIALGINKALSESKIYHKDSIWQDYIDSHTSESFARIMLSNN